MCVPRVTGTLITELHLGGPKWSMWGEDTGTVAEMPVHTKGITKIFSKAKSFLHHDSHLLISSPGFQYLTSGRQRRRCFQAKLISHVLSSYHWERLKENPGTFPGVARVWFGRLSSEPESSVEEGRRRTMVTDKFMSCGSWGSMVLLFYRTSRLKRMIIRNQAIAGTCLSV